MYLLVVDISNARVKVDLESAAKKASLHLARGLLTHSAALLLMKAKHFTSDLECPPWYRYNLDAQMNLDLIPLISPELSGTWRFLAAN